LDAFTARHCDSLLQQAKGLPDAARLDQTIVVWIALQQEARSGSKHTQIRQSTFYTPRRLPV